MKIHHTFYLLAGVKSLPKFHDLFVGKLLFISLLFSTGLFQSLCAQNITLYSQEEVNAFNQTVVKGSLKIYGQTVDPIIDLSPLNKLTEVTGDLRISNAQVSNLEGLKNLTSVGGDLYIGGGDRLVNLRGLERITMLKSLWISDNKKLTSLEGLEGLTNVKGTLRLDNNDSLATLKSLRACLDRLSGISCQNDGDKHEL